MLFKRKYEFKPDRAEGSTLKKLYLTPLQRKRLLKWSLVAAVLIVLSLLQDVVLAQVRIGGAAFSLVPCGILLFAMFLEAETAAIFTLTASTLYYFSGSAPGTFCIALLTCLGTLLCIFRRSYLQRCFSALVMCAGVGMMVYQLMLFAIGCFLEQTFAGRFGVFMLTGVLAVAAMPLIYPIFVSISNIGGETWKE